MLFTGRSEEYQGLVQKNVGAMDLLEEIPESKVFMAEKKYGDVIRVRRGEQVSLFNLTSFKEWFQRSRTHPETRVSVEFIATHLDFKWSVREHLPDLYFRDITDDFRRTCLEEFQKTPEPTGVLSYDLRLQIGIDLGYLERVGKIFLDFTQKQACEMFQGYPEGETYWLIRTSSQTPNRLPNSQIFTLSYRGRLKDSAGHVRFMDLHGAGIYNIGGFSTILTSSDELLATKKPFAATLVAAIWKVRSLWCEAQHWLVPPDK